VTLPDRSSLTADVRRPTVTVAYHNGTSWVDVTSHVLGATVQASLPDFLSFGAGPIPSAQVTLGVGAFTHLPAYAPIRIGYGLHSFSSAFRVFVGYVTQIERTPTEMVWRCNGIGDMIAARAIRIRVHRFRPAHTQTTATSIEDPNNPAYRAGMINELLWRAGGRPLEQQSSYPDAPWYYTCSHSLINPAWTWLDGENAWEDAGRLCRAVGSLLYQDGDGIVRCRSIIHAITGTPTFGWTDEILTAAQRATQNKHGYQSLQELRSYSDVPTTITVRYVRRAISAVGERYKDTIARVVAPAETISVSLTLQEPLVSLSRVELDAAELPTGIQLTPTVAVVQAQAQTVVLSITNPSTTRAMLITGIRLYGTCVEAIEQNEIQHASASPTTIIPRELRTEDNPYVQDEQHAFALALLLRTVYGTVRPVVRLRGCPSDPERRVGEIVTITSQNLNINNVRALILDIRHQDNAFMDVDCVLLPDIDDATMYYVINTTYTSSDVRLIGW
jgi:hypothetical protein